MAFPPQSSKLSAVPYEPATNFWLDAQKQVKEETYRFIVSLGEVSAGPWKQELKEILLTGLLSLAAQPAFLYQLGPPAQRWHHPQRAGPSHSSY